MRWWPWWCWYQVICWYILHHSPLWCVCCYIHFYRFWWMKHHETSPSWWDEWDGQSPDFFDDHGVAEGKESQTAVILDEFSGRILMFRQSHFQMAMVLKDWIGTDDGKMGGSMGGRFLSHSHIQSLMPVFPNCPWHIDWCISWMKGSTKLLFLCGLYSH